MKGLEKGDVLSLGHIAFGESGGYPWGGSGDSTEMQVITLGKPT